MNRITLLRFCICSLLIFSNCNKKTETSDIYLTVPKSSDFMVFDSVKLVTEFPNTHQFGIGTRVEKEIVGMWDFEIVDSLIVVSTKNRRGIWEVYKLPDFDYFGNFLSIGEGPTELSSIPAVSNKVFFDFSGSTRTATIYNFSKGGLLKLDFDQSKALGRDSIWSINDQLPAFLFDFLVLDSGFYFLRYPENMETQQNRYLDSSGVLVSRKVLEDLNFSSVSNGLNFALLASMSRAHKDGKRVVEMYFGLNYFNLYSLDGALRKTIALEPKLDEIRILEKTDQLERKFRFSDIRVYEDYFALLHLNEFEGDFASQRKSYPELLIFDWEGNPLAKFQFQEFFTSFDFDVNHGVLYTFDSQTDYFRTYKLPRVEF